MTKVVVHISMSLDGYITGPNVRREEPLGDGGEDLHRWMFEAKTEADAAVLDEVFASTGAILIGKTMFDQGFKPWGDPPPFGMPVFVLTHEARDPIPMQGGTTYTFVSDGIESGLEKARAAATERNVGIWGGANIVRQFLRAGLVDEMLIHVAPVLLDDGVQLFGDLGSPPIGLKKLSSVDTPSATHFRFEIPS